MTIVVVQRWADGIVILGYPAVPKSPTTSADLIVTQPHETIGALKTLLRPGRLGKKWVNNKMQNDKAEFNVGG